MFKVSILGLLYLGASFAGNLVNAYEQLKAKVVTPVNRFEVGALVVCAILLLAFNWKALFLGVAMTIFMRLTVNIINLLRGAKKPIVIQTQEEEEEPFSMGNEGKAFYTTANPSEHVKTAMEAAFEDAKIKAASKQGEHAAA